MSSCHDMSRSFFWISRKLGALVLCPLTHPVIHPIKNKSSTKLTRWTVEVFWINSILVRLCSLLGYFLLPCRASRSHAGLHLYWLPSPTKPSSGPAGNLQEAYRKTTLCHGNGFHPMSRSSPHGMESIEMAHWLASMWCSWSTVAWVANWWVDLTLNPCTLVFPFTAARDHATHGHWATIFCQA